MEKLFIQLKTVSGKKSAINNVKLLDLKEFWETSLSASWGLFLGT